jgi:hypothetical protein
LAWLSQGVDLDAKAREFGALVRVGKLRDGASLLRLALLYGPCGLSLRGVAAAAAGLGLAELTDKAVLGRLRKMGDWLEFLLGRALAQTPGVGDRTTVAGAVRLVDGTVIRGRGGNWRVHARYNPASGCFDDLVLTLEKIGEAVCRTAIALGDLLIADRGYARGRDFEAAHRAGGHFITRIGWRALRLCKPDGQPFDPLADLPATEQPIEHQVRVHRFAPALRFVITQIPEAKAAKQRERVKRRAARSGHQITDQTQLAAGYLMLVTTLPDSVSATTIVALYRTRWQIELAFKRLKSLGHIDMLPCRDQRLARVWLLAHLIAAVITDRTAAELAATPSPKPANRRPVSPWRLWKEARAIVLAAISLPSRRPNRTVVATIIGCLTEGRRRRIVQADQLLAA